MKISDRAKDLAKIMAERPTANHKMGAVITDKKNRIIGWGWNHKEGPKKKNDHSAGSVHAEVHALQKVDRKKLKGATMYTFRLRKNGSSGLAKPCEKHCQGLIHKLGFAYMVYSLDNDEWEIESLK